MTPPRLNEADFREPAPPPPKVFTPLAAGPHRDQETDPLDLTRDYVRYPTDQAWRAHLDHELGAATRRGDQATIDAVRAELAKLGDAT